MNFTKIIMIAAVLSGSVTPALADDSAHRLSREDLDVLPQCHALTDVQARNYGALAATLSGYRAQVPAEDMGEIDRLAANAQRARNYESAKSQAYMDIATHAVESIEIYRNRVNALSSLALQNIVIYSYAQFERAAVEELNDKVGKCDKHLTDFARSVSPSVRVPNPADYVR